MRVSLLLCSPMLLVCLLTNAGVAQDSIFGDSLKAARWEAQMLRDHLRKAPTARRLAVEKRDNARDLLRFRFEEFASGKTAFADFVLDAQRLLLDAELALATTAEEKAGAYERAWIISKRAEENEEMKFRAGVVQPAAFFAVRQRRLEMEALWVEARAKSEAENGKKALPIEEKKTDVPEEGKKGKPSGPPGPPKKLPPAEKFEKKKDAARAKPIVSDTALLRQIAKELRQLRFVRDKDAAAGARIEKLLDALTLPGLAEAACLGSWRTEPGWAGHEGVQALHRSCVDQLMKPLQKKLEGDALDRLAAAYLLIGLGRGDPPRGVELDPLIHVGVPGRPLVAERALPLLEALAADKDDGVRRAALRGLGAFVSEPVKQVESLAKAWKANPGDGDAIMQALQELVEERRFRPEAAKDDVREFFGAAFRLAGAGVEHKDKRTCQAAWRSVRAMVDMLQSRLPGVRLPPELINREEQAAWIATAAILNEIAKALAADLGNADASVAIAAHHALEAIARLDFAIDVSNLGAEIPRVEVSKQLAPLWKLCLPSLDKSLLDPEKREAALDVLESLEGGPIKATRPLLEALHDKDPFIRCAALRVLAWSAPREAGTTVPVLAGMLADPSAHVQKTALLALRRFGGAANVPASLNALRDIVVDAKHPLRQQAFLTVKETGLINKEIAEALLAALESSEHDMRLHAVEALGARRPLPEAVMTRLTKLLREDEDQRVREAAARLVLDRP